MTYTKLDLSAGPRYVFYSSLLSEKEDSLRNLGAHASNLLSSKASGLIPSKDNQAENEIDQVIKLLQIALRQEKEAELDFVKTKIFDNPIFQKYPKFFKKLKRGCSNLENFSYLSITSALNIGMRGLEDFKKNIDLELNRINQVKKNIEEYLKESPHKKQIMDSLYIERGGSFVNTSFKDLVSQGVKNTLAGERALKMKKVLEKILNEHKSDFIKKIEEKGALKVTEEELVEILQIPLANALISEIEGTRIDQIIADLLNDKNTSPSILGIKNKNKAAKIKQFDIKHDKEGIYSGENLYDTFKELYDAGERGALTILDGYLSDEANTSKKDLIGSFAEMVNKIIEMERNGVSKKSIASKKGAFSKRIKIHINKMGVLAAIKQALTKIQVTIKRPELSEITAGIQASLNIKGSEIYIEGDDFLKNDFVITVNFPDDILKSVYNSIESDFYNQVKKQEELIRTVENVAKGKEFKTTNVTATMALYEVLQKMDILQSQKNNQLFEASAIQKELNALKDSFYIQGSAKDLLTYNNDIGFVGGTLGNSIDEAINNLLNMYEKGGITPIDKNWLTLAIMNTSSESIGSYLKSPIERYLSFSAAMLMFGQGGSQMALAGEEIHNKFKVLNKPKILNLYYLNSNYYPSSIVLQAILNNLTNIYSSLLHLMNKATQNKTGVVIENNSYYGMIENNFSSRSDAWTKYGEVTAEKTKINFVFLAGILDILEKLNNQVKNMDI